MVAPRTTTTTNEISTDEVIFAVFTLADGIYGVRVDQVRENKYARYHSGAGHCGGVKR